MALGAYLIRPYELERGMILDGRYVWTTRVAADEDFETITVSYTTRGPQTHLPINRHLIAVKDDETGRTIVTSKWKQLPSPAEKAAYDARRFAEDMDEELLREAATRQRRAAQ